MERNETVAPPDLTMPVLEARGMVKRYGHVEALRGADFSAFAGEVVALIGDNGAGKSTLVRLLAGVEAADDGEILLNGEPVQLTSPTVAQQRGIEVVYQDLALATDLDTPANLFLGREVSRRGLLGKLGFLDLGGMRTQTRAIFEKFGVALAEIDMSVSALSGGQRQSVAVARAVAFASRLVFMDEPTAALGVQQTGKVHELIRRICDQGMTVVLISHNMPEVLEVSDRIEVLRLGRRVAAFNTKEATLEDLVGAMTGGNAAGRATSNRVN